MTSPMLRSWPASTLRGRSGLALAVLLSSASGALGATLPAQGTEAVEAAAPKAAMAAETPLFGGRVIVHMASLPENMSYPIENSAVTRRMLYEVSETLVLKDWETTEWVPSVAKAWFEEDMLVLNDLMEGEAKIDGEVEVAVFRSLDDGTFDEENLVPRRAIYGSITETEAGWIVEPVSPGSDLKETVTIPKAKGERVEKASVVTFQLLSLIHI